MRLLGLVAFCAVFLMTSGAGANDDPQLREWAIKVIHPHLAKFAKCPPASKSRREHGEVYVNFTINRKGELLDTRMIRETKFKDLNDAALAAIRDAKPFPPFPAGIEQDRISLRVPFDFSSIGKLSLSSQKDVKPPEIHLPPLSPSPSRVPIEPADCDALKNTTLPYQLKWKADDTEMAQQVFRQSPEGIVVWRSLKPSDGTIEIDNFSIIEGPGSEGSQTNNWVSGPNKRAIKASVSGLPKTFDRRSNATYTQTISSTDDKGATTKWILPTEYEFIRETKKAFGSCVLDLVIGRQRYVRNGKPEAWSYAYYLPQLKGSYMQPFAGDFELTTKFEQLKHFK